jgi:hypothetical protein
MLKEVGLPNMFDALDHECETGDHQRHKVLECACRIQNSLSNMFLTKQVESDESGAGERAEKYKAWLKYCEL